MEPARRKRSVVLGICVVAVLGASVAGVAELSELALERTERRAMDCLDELSKSGEGDPDDCRPAGVRSWAVRVASELPGLRGKARQKAVDLEARVVNSELDVAAVRDLDAGARDAAARARVALDRGEVVPDTGEEVLQPETDWLLADFGALEVLVESVIAGELEDARDLALDAALIFGDWDAALEVAKLPSESFYNARRGAIVACIAGDRELAQAKLSESEARVSDWWEIQELRRIELHCELPLGPVHKLASYAQIELRQAAGLYVGERIEGNFGVNDARWLQLLALRTKGPPEELFVASVDDYARLELISMRSRDDIRGDEDWLIVGDLEAGARRMIELGDQAPAEYVLERGSDVLTARVIWYRAGFSLAATAAAERLWRGQPTEAGDDLALIDGLLAREELAEQRLAWERSILGLRAELDFDAALRVAHELVAAGITDGDAAEVVARALELALIFERAGELDSALRMAEVAFDRIPRVQPDLVYGYLLELATRSIHARLLLELEPGRAAELSAGAPEDLREHRSIEQVIAYWLAAATTADDAARAGYRWRSSLGYRLAGAHRPWFSPITLELIARSAPAEGREVWLDTIASKIDLDPLSVVRIRRATAERLGDTAAVERWAGRELALARRLRSDRAAALYRMLD